MAGGKRARAAKAVGLRPRDARALLTTMWRIRCFEERVAQLYRTLQVHGLIHLSIGSEGVAAAVCGHLRDEDAVYSGHRAHGHALAKGAPMNETMAELMGRSAGLCQGLGGSMHLVDTAHGLMGATGVVGGNLPMAAGDALKSKLDGSDRVTVVFFGDGAVQAGHFHETINLAALWELPVIFVCENNGMAEFTPRSAHTRVASVCDVVAPYGFERRIVDGSDVEALFSTAGEFVAAARAGKGGRGPFFIECSTHRFRGHYEGDQQAYRDELEGSETAKLDPIVTLERLAVMRRWLRKSDARAIEAAARDEVEEAVAFGRDSPPSTEAEAAELVYAQTGGLTAMARVTTFVQEINGALARAMREDPRVIVLGEDVAEGGPYQATASLAEEFGVQRVLNTPISEGAVCGVAIGAAQAGLRPVVEIMFIDFITLALDQLVNQAAKARYMSGGQLSVPLVLRTQGGSGGRAGAQHSQSLEAWLTHVPGLKVVMPSSAADAAGLLASAIADPDPVVFVENKSLYFRREPAPETPAPLPLGRAHRVRAGADVTIVALSRMVSEAMAAAERLADEGIEAEVIDPRTLVPLDLDPIAESVRRTGRAVVAHEAVRSGGFGAELAAQLQDAAFDYLEAPIQRVGAPFTPVPLSPSLEDAYRPGSEEIVAAARTAVQWADRQDPIPVGVGGFGER